MSNERYDENNHLDLNHAPSLGTYIGKTLASHVSGNRMPEISGDNRKRIPQHIRARYDRDCERLAEEVLRYITKAAPASPLPEGGGWQDISTAPKDGTKVLGWADGDFTVVEWSPGDYWTLSECGAYASDGEWWPTHWMPLPAAPTGDA